MFDLTGRIAVVTGAGRGLGAAMARALAKAGAEVILVGRTRAPLEEMAAAIRHDNGRAGVATCDISSSEDIAAMVSGIYARHSRIDILINNAGIQSRAPLPEVAKTTWDAMIETHLTGPFMTCQAVLPGMFAQGSGKIINTVSVLGELGRPLVVPYAAAKGGLRMLTRGLATEVARRNIQVNAIGPGYFLTEINRDIMDDRAYFDRVVERVPAGRWGDPADIGGTAVFLASRASDYVSGQIIYVDGGLTASF